VHARSWPDAECVTVRGGLAEPDGYAYADADAV